MRFGQCQAQNDEIAGPARNDGWAWNDGGMDSATTRRMTVQRACPNSPPPEGAGEA